MAYPNPGLLVSPRNQWVIDAIFFTKPHHPLKVGFETNPRAKDFLKRVKDKNKNEAVRYTQPQQLNVLNRNIFFDLPRLKPKSISSNSFVHTNDCFLLEISLSGKYPIDLGSSTRFIRVTISRFLTPRLGRGGGGGALIQRQ